MSAAKLHNAGRAVKAKADIRLHVLEHVRPARVFDAFCGPTGEMWQRVWREADDYVGVDREWHITDPRRRYVGDNVAVMRSIDLGRFNIFDLDAFGSPYELLCILLARRPWARDERGGLIVTDGTSGKLRFGQVFGALGALTKFKGGNRIAPSAGTARQLQTMALTRWCERARVKPLRMWEVDTPGSGKGSFAMRYVAVVFDGLGAESSGENVERELRL